MSQTGPMNLCPAETSAIGTEITAMLSDVAQSKKKDFETVVGATFC